MQRDDIFTLAELARIDVSPTEADFFATSIGKIMHLVEQLNAVDVTNITPMLHPYADSTPKRPDKITETDQVNLLLKTAPKTAAGLFLVPQVLES